MPRPPQAAEEVSALPRAEAEAAALRELDRVFDKAQFREMKVVGQFNLGFILTRCASCMRAWLGAPHACLAR